MNTFPDDCEDCKQNKAEYIVMLEGEQDWIVVEKKKVCGNCISKYQDRMIECWTYQEWINEE